MLSNDIRTLTVSRMGDFPVRYDVRVQLDNCCASVYIEGENGESCADVTSRALAKAYSLRIADHGE